MTKPLAVEATHEATWKAQNLNRIKVLAHGIKRSTQFAELKKNPVFKELILDLYIKEEGANLIELIADPQMNLPQQQASVQMRLGGISALQTFMRQYDQAGATAQAEVAQLKAINVRLDQGISVEQILIELEEAKG